MRRCAIFVLLLIASIAEASVYTPKTGPQIDALVAAGYGSLTTQRLQEIGTTVKNATPPNYDAVYAQLQTAASADERNFAATLWTGGPIPPAPTPPAGPASSIDTLQRHPVDNTTEPTDGQALVYNAATGFWRPASVTGSGTVPDAATGTKGVNKLSVAPASAGNPIAAGDNDPRMTDQRAPSDASVTSAKLAAGTPVPWAKIDRSAARTAAGKIKDIWISDREIATGGDGLDGSGSHADPYNGGTQTKFDAILASSTKAPAHAAIHIEPGTFITKGFTVRDGWRLYLTPETILQLKVFTAGEAAALPASRILAMVYSGGGTYNQDVLIDGGTWDMNMQNQTQALCPSAIQVVVDGLRVQHIKVINPANRSPTNNELFVVGNFSNGLRDSHIHRKQTVWDDIEVTQLASGVTNAGTISLVNTNGGQDVASNSSLSNGWFENVVIKNCWFHDITTTDSVTIAVVNFGGWVKSFHAHHNRFENITGAVGAAVPAGYYIDTGSFINAKIDNDNFANVFRGIFTIGGSGWVRSGLKISNTRMSEVSFAGIQFAETGATATDYTVENCDISATSSGVIGVAATNVSGFHLRGGTIDTPSGPALTIGTGTTVVENSAAIKADGTVVGTPTAGRFIITTTTGTTNVQVVPPWTKTVVIDSASALTEHMFIKAPYHANFDQFVIIDPRGRINSTQNLFVQRDGSDTTVNGVATSDSAAIKAGGQQIIVTTNNVDGISVARGAPGNLGVNTLGVLGQMTVHTGTNENLAFRRGSDLVGGGAGVGVQSINDAFTTVGMYVIDGIPVVMPRGLNVGGTSNPGTGVIESANGNRVGTLGTLFSRLRHGRATLVAGTVTVGDTNVTANTRIIPSWSTDGGTPGVRLKVTRSAGTSFTVASVDAAGATVTTDTSVIDYEMLEP